jgi:hypothetical protein
MIRNCEIFSLLDKKNLLGGQLPPVLWHWRVGLLSQTNKQTPLKKETKNYRKMYVLLNLYIKIK